MRTAERLGLALAVVVLVRSDALGQLPVAPHPHSTLDDLVKEYRRLGLPEPPANAELVKVGLKHDAEGNLDEHYELVFRLPPATPHGPPRYFLGNRPRVWPGEMDTEEPVPPTRDALLGVQPYLEDLRLAVHCRMRGWNELAAALYDRAREFMAEYDVYQEFDDPSLYIIRDQGWLFWLFLLTDRDSDWRTIHRRLKEIYELDERFRTEEHGELLTKLENAIFHKRTARPGTPEALIDELVDHWENDDDHSDMSGQTAYWRLAELGFDAVPALLDHLNDTRLTRTFSFGFNVRSAHHVTVGHLCSRLINCLSARTADDQYWEARGDYLNNEKATVWFAEAKRIGEEKWLVDHVLPPGGGGGFVNHPRATEREIARALAAKYPARLPAVYRRALRGPISDQLEDFVPEIVASKLTREAKAELLAEGAAHADFRHRVNALRGLSKVDPPRFCRHLRQTLDAIAAGPNDTPWVTDAGSLAEFVVQAGDEGCWDALIAATKQLPPGGRMSVALEVGRVAPTAENDPARRHRLRVLLPMLADSEREDDGADVPLVPIRDYAAAQLAGLFGQPVFRDPETFVVYPDLKSDPLTRFAQRCVVWKLATDELARPRK